MPGGESTPGGGARAPASCGCGAGATTPRCARPTSARPSASPTSSTSRAGRRSRAPTASGSAPRPIFPRRTAAWPSSRSARKPEDQARRLARSRDLFIVRLYTGRPAPYPSVEEAERYPYNAQEVAIARHAARRSVVGTPEQVRERLLAMVADYHAAELIVVTITHDFN